MSQQGYTVTFTTGLIEKLAGVRKPKPVPAAQQRSQQAQAPTLFNPELLALKQKDAQLAKALKSSQRVGQLLLKAEEEETAKVKELAGDLLQAYRSTVKPVPCQSERQACVDCYKANPEDPLKCANLVNAYSQCANAAYDDFLRRKQHA